MLAHQDRVTRIITRLASVVALLVAISLPLAYGLTELNGFARALEYKARVKAAALDGLIATTPDLWIFAENRMQGLISREPVPLGNEWVRVFDGADQLVLESGKAPAAPVMSRSHSLFDAGQVVGRVEMTDSLRGVAYATGGAAGISFCLGALVFVVMRVLPLKALRRVTTSLIEEKERAETTLRAISDAVITSDGQGRLRQVNPAGVMMMGGEAMEPLIGQSVLEHIAPEYRAAFAEVHQRVLAGKPEQLKYEAIDRHGRRRWLEARAVPLQDHGQPMCLTVSRDITERREAELALQESEERFRSLMENIPGVAVQGYTLDGTVMFWNSASEHLYGYSRREAMGRNLLDLIIPAEMRKGVSGAIAQMAATGQPIAAGELLLKHKNGSRVPVLSSHVLVNPFGHLPELFCMDVDLSERRRVEEEVRQLAFHDSLTRLPNRRLLVDRLRQAMAAGQRSHLHGALIFLDLDHFKPLNDAHGHEVGDLLLIEAADRLKSCMREIDTVARFGGDEFVVLLGGLSADLAESTSQAEMVAEKIRLSLSEPYLLRVTHGGEALRTIEHHCTASIGVALFLAHPGRRDDILNWADAAMYQAKKAGRNQICFHDPSAFVNRA
ncbi:MAG: diguanylate cyclase [Candidatus Accumulibacter sp. UW20]|jgi:diguanylate cyclase (GGDEF)-like protein/PAS domain S-box-containing protein